MGGFGNNSPWGNTQFGGGSGGSGQNFTQGSGPPQTTKVSTATPVLWSNGNLFNGWLMLGIALPTGAAGSSFPSITLWGNMPPQPLPQWVMIPIVQGQLDQNTSVFQSIYLDPPGCKYVAYWLDTNKNIIFPSGGATPALFDIAQGSYVIQQPYLATPSTPNVIPAPQLPGSVASTISGNVFATPAYETPTGNIDGNNRVFGISRVPNVLMFYVDGQLQDPNTYGVSGATITLTVAPVVGSILTAIIF